MTLNLELAATAEPMRPRTPRRMRPAGRASRPPFHPTLVTALQAAANGELQRNRHGRYVDLRGWPVDQTAVRAAINTGLLDRSEQTAGLGRQDLFPTAAGYARIALETS